MSDKAKEPNYSPEAEALLRKEYESNPCTETVMQLVEELGKSKRSIISKLSNMGIYVTPPRTTKTGQPIVKKEQLVEEICEALNVKAPSLVKANKQDLIRLVKAVAGETE